MLGGCTHGLPDNPTPTKLLAVYDAWGYMVREGKFKTKEIVNENLSDAVHDMATRFPKIFDDEETFGLMVATFIFHGTQTLLDIPECWEIDKGAEAYLSRLNHHD